MDKKVLVLDYERESVDFNKIKEISLKGRFSDYTISKDFKFSLNYDFYISKDHSISYDLLKKVKKKVALIIFDQHMDMWSETIIGNELNKSNFIRKAFDENLIEYVVFVGVRKNELASFKKDLFLDKFDKEFTKNLIVENKFEKYKDKIKIIKTKDFAKGFNKAVKILKNKGFENICLDIDLDVFDSDIIKGVEYTKENLINVIDESTGRYLENTFSQKGISPKIKFNKIKKDINLVYKHITEYDPKFDDGKTLNLIKEIINGI